MHKQSELISLLLFLCLCIGISEKVSAQATITSKVKIHPFNPDSNYGLGDWVIGETIRAYADNELISSNQWQFNSTDRTWSIRPQFTSLFASVREVKIEFEAYPLAIRRVFKNREIQNIDSSLYDFKSDSLTRIFLRNSSEYNFNDSELEQSGSLSRGIIVGSNQDFALESGLQFELNGQLTDDVSINASLTDKSIPIQPDGTTQNLREFDRIFIQLQSSKTSLEMGDVDVSFEQSTFAKLNRRLQGAAGNTTTNYGDYHGALSVVRGVYKSLTFEGKDGVQGPYRLSGRNGEEFVIVLAGTERVYINGRQVDRGEENDYIIDYGLGEVFFTNNLLIKDETRIIVEYEYIDQNFNRTLVAAEVKEEFFNGKFRFGTSVIRQADGDELLSQQSLTEEDIGLLRGVGDNLSSAIVTGERIATDEDENNVLYAKIDTTYNGENITIFKNIPGSSESVYTVRFSKIEGETGSYRRISGTVNGLLYEWVGPGLGEYEPFRKLPAPEQQQMMAINTALDISKNIEIYGEWAASSFDKNRFSSIDDNDNNDFSYLSGIKIKEVNSGIGKIEGSFSRRYSGERFQFFERTRDVEFTRKWDISRNVQTEETLNEAEFGIKPSSNTAILGEYGIIERNDYKGYRQGLSFITNEPKFLNFSYNQDWIRTEDQVLNQKGNWFRHQASLTETFFNNWTPYLRFDQERKIQKSQLTDSLLNASFSFLELGPGLRYKSKALVADISIVYRLEEGVLENELQDQSRAIEQRVKLNYRANENFETQNEVAIRSKNFSQSFEELGRAKRAGLLIRSVTDYSTESEGVRGQLFYEANTQQRALLQEAYIEVGAELGQYVWIDSNEDGVQQIDEFFLELSPNEGTYVKQYLPSDQLFPVIDLKTRIRNEIKPFQKYSALGSFLREIQLRSRIDVSENSTTTNLSDVYLLRVNTFRNDSTTIQGKIFWEQELGLFSEMRKIDMTIGYNESKSINQRTTDSQELVSSSLYLYSSFQLSEKSRLNTDLITLKNKSLSSQLSSRNFNIKSYAIIPSLESTINRSWQTSIAVSYTSKEDVFPSEKVKARIFKITNTHRTFLFKKLQGNVRLELRNAEVEGASSALGDYELTEGTGIGTNIIWAISGTYRISNLIRLSFNYDGRTVKGLPDIHTMKLVVSAVF